MRTRRANGPSIVPATSQELLLALACAMWPRANLRSKEIKLAATGAIDWHRFLRVIRRHEIVGLAHDGLQQETVAMPAEIAHVVRQEARASSCRNLVMAAEAVHLQRLFDGAGLNVIFLKGVSLGVLAYGNIGLREAKDIDLLVSAKDVDNATYILKCASYRRILPPEGIGSSQLGMLTSLRKDFCFVHQESGIQVELHWRLFLNRYSMDETSAFSASRLVSLSPHVTLRTLGEEDLFSYLCVHGSLHWWSKLKWLADVGALLAPMRDDHLKRLYLAAEARGAGYAAAQALSLCERLFNAHIPSSLLAGRKSARAKWLERNSLAVMSFGNGELDPRGLPFGTTRGSILAFLLGRGWRYWLVELRHLLINGEDVLSLPLPRQFHFLYPIIRLPSWLAKQITRRRI